MLKYNGQIEQDKFVLNVLNNKHNGFFLEIGANDPCQISNTYLLEKEFQWSGIMIEYDSKYLNSYKIHRPNSIPIINDATKIDYKDLLHKHNVSRNIDYLQIDLEVSNGSTIQTLELIEKDLMSDNYKFATITFEHDIYATNYMNTQSKSRDIFRKNGYFCVFENLNNNGINAFEDWWVHPDLVNMEYIITLQQRNQSKYKPDNVSGQSINPFEIEY